MIKKQSILLVMILLFSLIGCTTITPTPVIEVDRSLKIGISVYDQYDTFVGEFIDSFEQQSKEKESTSDLVITIMRENADGSQSLQNTQVQNFIEAGCDIICVNLVDRTDASTIIDMAEASDTPVIFFNRELVKADLERWDKLYYVGAPAIESGIMQGQIVSAACREDLNRIDLSGDGIIQYVILEGEADHQDAAIRTEFSVKTIASDGYGLERLEVGIANWSRAQAETKTGQWITNYGTQIELILANNDDMALGAIDALKKSDLSDDYWPFIVGVDGTSLGLEAILDGTLNGTVQNNAVGQAKGMLELSCWVIHQTPFSPDIVLTNNKYVRLPYTIITADNIDDFIK